MQSSEDKAGEELVKSFVQHAYIVSFFVTLIISAEHAIVAKFVFKNHLTQFNYLQSKCLNDSSSSSMMDLNISESVSYDAFVDTVFVDENSSFKEVGCCNQTKESYVRNAKISIWLHFCSILFLSLTLIGYLNLCYDKIIQNSDTLSTKTKYLKIILRFTNRTNIGIFLTFVLNFWILLYFKVKLEFNLFKDIHC